MRIGALYRSCWKAGRSVAFEQLCKLKQSVTGGCAGLQSINPPPGPGGGEPAWPGGKGARPVSGRTQVRIPASAHFSLSKKL